MAERLLVEHAARGDRDAFDALVDTSIDRLYAAARLILRDADAAEDAVQEALVRAWQGLPRLRHPERFDGWLHRLLVNAALDEYRARRRMRTSVALIRVVPAEGDPASALADRDALARAFEALRVEHRVVLVLQQFLGLSIQEMAEALDVPVGTVKSRVHYALSAMRARLDADERMDRMQETAG